MNIKKLTLSWFGLGFMPFAPGTWGSVFPVAIFVIAHILNWPVVIISALLLAILIISSYCCLAFASEAEKIAGKTDPGWIVADEVAGQTIALVPLIFVQTNMLIAAAAAFLLFRFFDITKIWPICKAEKLHGGVGILADDLVAGVFAAIILYIGCIYI